MSRLSAPCCRPAATPFDASMLAAGTYEVVVTAADSAGNQGTGRVSFVVDSSALQSR